MNFQIKHRFHDIPKEYNIRFRHLQSLKISTYRRYPVNVEKEYFSNRYNFAIIYDLISRLKNLVKIDIEVQYRLIEHFKQIFEVAIAHKIGEKIQDIKITWCGKRHQMLKPDYANMRLILKWINGCKLLKSLFLDHACQNLFYMITNKLFPWQTIEKIVLNHQNIPLKLLPRL